MTSRILLFFFLTTIIFSSCKKCRNCNCSLNGVTSNEQECVRGNDTKHDLDAWQKDMMKQKGYQTCDCFDK